MSLRFRQEDSWQESFGRIHFARKEALQRLPGFLPLSVTHTLSPETPRVERNGTFVTVAQTARRQSTFRDNPQLSTV